MALRWALCDRSGVTVAEVEDRLPGGTVGLVLDGLKTAGLSVPFGSVAAEIFPFMRGLKVWLDDEPEPIFAGPILTPRFLIVPERRVEIAAIDPGFFLQAAFVNNRGDTNFDTGVGVFVEQLAVDQSEILARLMEHASPTSAEVAAGTPGHGIIRGSLPASVNRDRSYETGFQILQAFTDMSQVDGGPDFDFTPLDRTDGTWAKLDTFYPRRGADRSSDVTFESGFGADNVAALAYAPGGEETANRHTTIGQSVEGQPPNYYRANQPDSQRLFGIIQAFESRTDVVYSGTLQDIARAACGRTAFPPAFFEITPALDDGTGRRRDPTTGRIVKVGGDFRVPPRFAPSGDYWMGDTVGVRAYDRPTVGFEQTGRVYEASLTEDADGAVIVETRLTPTVTTASVI